MTGFQKLCWFVLIPLMSLIAISLILFALGYVTTASLVSDLGTPLVLLGALVYAVVFDSKKRWPDLPWYERFTKIMSFQR